MLLLIVTEVYVWTYFCYLFNTLLYGLLTLHPYISSSNARQWQVAELFTPLFFYISIALSTLIL